MVDAGKPSHPMVPHRVPPNRRQIIAQVIVSLIILISGIIIGGGGTVLALKDRIVPVIRPSDPNKKTPGRDPNEAAKRSDWIATRWRDEYGLDDRQTERAREILAKEFAATDSLWDEFRKVEQTQREKFVLAIKGILTAEQFAKWEPDFRRMVERMQSMRPFDPHRGGRGGPRPDWRPERRVDPNDPRGGWSPGPPRDPNGPRGDWPRDGFKGPGSRRGDWGRDRPRDPNAPRGPRPPERFTDPNSRPGNFGEPR